MPPLRRLLLVVTATLLAPVCATPGIRETARFSATIAQLSEPGGFFNSDNLISNERSYLHVIPALREAGLNGGAYLGVGPDQNFTYIAHTRPSIAFIIDIRRDNLLLHLLLKALFRLSDNRAEYVSLLFGRPPPDHAARWKHADIERIVEYIDATAAPPEATATVQARVRAAIRGIGLPVTEADLDRIEGFHRTFIERGLGVQFESAGRPPRSDYPTYRQLLLETDKGGRRWNYLASESDFQFVRSLQERNLVVPVVGDLAGPTAMRAIGRLLKERGDRLSVFYTSNVEYYLASRGVFEQFVANLAELPHADRSVIIRSVFPNRFGWTPRMPGYLSDSFVQPVGDLLDGVASGRIREYGDLITTAR